MKTVLITGASSGIGRATAEYLASRGWQVFAGVRKAEDGAPLVAAQPNIEPIILDVVKPEQVRDASAEVSLALKGKTLDGLINNAGIANIGPLPLQPMDEVRAHFDINVLGLVEVTQAFCPLLGMDTDRTGSPGRVINISSFGGRMAAPFLGAYSATKAAVESLTDSFRRELLVYGIDCITIAPGAIKTPIWDKAEEKDKAQPYANSPWAKPVKKFTQSFLEAGENGWPAEDLAAKIEMALTDASPRAYYAFGPDKLVNYTIASRLPKRILDKGFANRMGLKPLNELKD